VSRRGRGSILVDGGRSREADAGGVLSGSRCECVLGGCVYQEIHDPDDTVCGCPYGLCGRCYRIISRHSFRIGQFSVTSFTPIYFPDSVLTPSTSHTGQNQTPRQGLDIQGSPRSHQAHDEDGRSVGVVRGDGGDLLEACFMERRVLWKYFPD
jgi:hypothetical protein